jgi:hypothetical protein
VAEAEALAHWVALHNCVDQHRVVLAKIKVDVIGSKPNASPKGFGRSPTIAFPGAVKTFTLTVFDATGAVTRVVSFTPFAGPILYSLDVRASDSSKRGRKD